MGALARFTVHRCQQINLSVFRLVTRTSAVRKILAMFNFKTSSRLCIVLLLLFLMIGWKAKTAQTQSTADKPVEQVRKNIQVLKGLPDSQLFLLMNFVGDSVGVNCDYCHVKGE